AAPAPAIAASGAPGPASTPAADAPEPAAQPAEAREPLLPMDALTLLFAYHKLSGEPLDFDKIARNMNVVWRANAFDRDKVAAEEAARLQTLFQAVDTAAPYSVALRTSTRYEMAQERFDVETFGPDRFLSYSPFGNQFMDQTL